MLVPLILREANDLGYEVRLGIRVRDPVLAEALGGFVLEAGVPFGDLGVCPQVVAEEDVALPERGVRPLYQVDLVGAPPPAQLTKVASKGHLLLEFGHVLVAYSFQASDEGGRILEAPDAHHDVYDRFGRQA